MRLVNLVVGWLIAALLRPFESWPPIAGLTVVSLIVAAGLLVAFKLTSNQRALASAKRSIRAGLFELRLFQDDPRLMLRASAGLLRQQAVYLRHAFVPLLWVSIPLSLLLAQLQAYYGYEGLRPGQSAIVSVRVGADAAAAQTDRRGGDPSLPLLVLEAPPGLRVETPCVWVPSLREAAWRIAADREGDYDLRVTWNGASPEASTNASTSASLTKRVRVTSRVVAFAPVRPAAGVWSEWRYPAEPPLPAGGPIEAIAVAYPERAIDLHVLNLSLPWLVLFLVFTTAGMLAGRSLLDVVF
jgi:hypothetical protein